MGTSGSGQSPIAPADSVARPARDAGPLERLRELLLAPEVRALVEVRGRLADLEASQQALARRLPGALEALQGEAETRRMAAALSAPVAQALGTAVRTRRQLLVDALFPVIGPLIRKSIAEALRNLVADLNAAIESSFTLRGLKWRIEAWRAGVPYAEVVLKHRLAYRIDHVFLIERASGRVLWHAAAPELAALDADAIAGMLTALGDFVQDSVGAGEGGGNLESATVGEHLVWIASGPAANLACFMRGAPPERLRSRLQERLEEVHARCADGWPEQGRPLPEWDGLLQPSALLSAGDAAAPATPPARLWPWILLLGLTACGLVAWLLGNHVWDTRIQALRARLAAQPGMIVGAIDSRPWRSLTVHGLIDPDAPPLDAGVVAAGLGGVVPTLALDGYVSTDDAVVARRAARLLAPPATVTLGVQQGVLRLEGSAPGAWLAAARERAGWIAGVARVDLAVQPQADPAASALLELRGLARELEDIEVPFTEGDAPGPGADAQLAAIVERARRARVLAGQAGVDLVLESVGSNDETGGVEINRRVRAQRAQWLATALAARGIDGVRSTDVGSGRHRSAWLRLAIGDVP